MGQSTHRRLGLAHLSACLVEDGRTRRHAAGGSRRCGARPWSCSLAWLRRQGGGVSNTTRPCRGEANRGADSDFYQIEQALLPSSGRNHPGETVFDWLRRVESTATISEQELLYAVASLHYRYRFDPTGLTASERKSLRELSKRWLDAYRAIDRTG